MPETAEFVLQAETALLGALLQGGDNGATIAMLDERYFGEPINQVIFTAIKTAHERYSATTVPVVMQLIPQAAKDSYKASMGVDIGGYLGRCYADNIYTAATSVRAARNVINQWARVNLAKELRTAGEAASHNSADPLFIMREISSAMEEIGSNLRLGSRGRTRSSFREATVALFAEVRAAIERGGPPGVPTGLADLDRLMGGLHKRDLILLGARPSMGKTSLATCIAANAAASGHGVGIFSLEMDTAKLTARMVSDFGYRAGVRIPYEQLINTPDTQSAETLEKSASFFDTLPLIIDDSTGLTLGEMRPKIEGMIADAEAGGFTLDLVVVDHLLKLQASANYRGNRVYEIGELTSGLKSLAREYGLSMLCLTQLNRAVEQRDDKRPQLADLRDSGSIEQDADAVLFLYRDAYYLQRQQPPNMEAEMARDQALALCRNVAEINIAKQRNGRTETVQVFADIAFSHFSNAARAGYAEMSAYYRGEAA